MLSLLIAAAEPSKVPFYIAGAVFAGWAVVLVDDRPDAPELPVRRSRASGRSSRISLLLAGLAIAMAIVTDP